MISAVTPFNSHVTNVNEGSLVPDWYDKTAVPLHSVNLLTHMYTRVITTRQFDYHKRSIVHACGSDSLTARLDDLKENNMHVQRNSTRICVMDGVWLVTPLKCNNVLVTHCITRVVAPSNELRTYVHGDILVGYPVAV